MKKLAVVLCASCVFFAAASAFAADGLDTHEAGFGPVVKGLQLGAHTTVREVFQSYSSGHWSIHVGTPYNDRKYATTLMVAYMDLSEDKTKYEVAYAVPPDSTNYVRRSRTLEEIIKEIESYPDFRVYFSFLPVGDSFQCTIERRKNGPVRYARLIFHRERNFDAGKMSDATWRETLLKAYPLLAETKSSVSPGGGIFFGSKGMVSGGKDGWCYGVDEVCLLLRSVNMNYDYNSTVQSVPSTFN
jgi:hypothetical protein